MHLDVGVDAEVPVAAEGYVPGEIWTMVYSDGDLTVLIVTTKSPRKFTIVVTEGL